MFDLFKLHRITKLLMIFFILADFSPRQIHAATISSSLGSFFSSGHKCSFSVDGIPINLDIDRKLPFKAMNSLTLSYVDNDGNSVQYVYQSESELTDIDCEVSGYGGYVCEVKDEDSVVSSIQDYTLSGGDISLMLKRKRFRSSLLILPVGENQSCAKKKLYN